MPLSAPDRALLEKLPEAALLALVAFLEARSEPIRGILGVMWVVRNRRSKQPEASIAEVVLAPWQFSCFNPNDRQYEIGMGLARRLHDHDPVWDQPDGVILTVCLFLADAVLDAPRRAPDPTSGATHYHHRDIYPKWAQPPAKVSAIIGQHRFYTGVS